MEAAFFNGSITDALVSEVGENCALKMPLLCLLLIF